MKTHECPQKRELINKHFPKQKTQVPVKHSKKNWVKQKTWGWVKSYQNKLTMETRKTTKMSCQKPFVYPFSLFIPTYTSPVTTERPPKVCGIYLCSEGRIHSKLRVDIAYIEFWVQNILTPRDLVWSVKKLVGK